jgi:hypothetical protein
LSKRFSTSKEVVLRRLLAAGLTTPAFYDMKREDFLEEYEKLKTKAGTEGFLPPARKAIVDSGFMFSKMVLEGLSSGHVSISNFSDYMGVRNKHLPAIEQMVMSRVRKVAEL